jgi:hypothetical protein
VIRIVSDVLEVLRALKIIKGFNRKYAVKIAFLAFRKREVAKA